MGKDIQVQIKVMLISCHLHLLQKLHHHLLLSLPSHADGLQCKNHPPLEEEEGGGRMEEERSKKRGSRESEEESEEEGGVKGCEKWKEKRRRGEEYAVKWDIVIGEQQVHKEDILP